MSKHVAVKYFFEECSVEVHTRQQKTRQDLNNEDAATEQEIKQNYEESEAIYSTVTRDNDLLSGAISDPAFNYLFKDPEKRRAFHESRKRTLKKILVNSASANRKAETKDLEEQLQSTLDEIGYLDRKLSIDAINKQKAAAKKRAEDARMARSWIKAVADYLKSLSELNPTAFIRWVGNLNLYRLSWTFSRISWKTMWLYLQQLGILSSESTLHGVPINITIMDAPTSVFNFLSVYFFIARLGVEISLPIKHAAAPTYVAEEAFSPGKRAVIEIKRQWVNFFNDSWWLIFNAITNFPKTFGVAIPVAGWILTGALFFDVGLLFFVSRYEEAESAAKIKWLDERIKDKYDPESKENINAKAQKIRNKLEGLNIAGIDNQIKWINKELPNINDTELRVKAALLSALKDNAPGIQQDSFENEIGKTNKQLELYHIDLDTHTHVFKAMKNQALIQRDGFRALMVALVFATVLFITSLALTLSLASPIVAPIGFFICVVAVAFILSRSEFSQIAAARAAKNYNQDELIADDGDRQHVKHLRDEKEKEAWKEFAKTFAENVFVPMLIIGLYTINWPLAIVFTVTYVFYKCFQDAEKSAPSTDGPNAVMSEAGNLFIGV